MTANNKSRRYATVMHPTIGAVLAGTYRFASEEQAKQQLQVFRNHFVLSRHQNEESNDNSIILWIKGYAITDDEKKNCYTGNYAVVGIKKRRNGKFALEAVKLESDIKYHPQRQRPKHKHPNWGHPILRSVKKKRIYENVEAAQKELQLLHEEFPEVTIPLSTKLYLIIYSRQQEPPAQKYVLEIKVNEEGGFYLDAYSNDYKGPKDIPNTQNADEAEKPDPKAAGGGYFTSMVALKRSRKKPASPEGSSDKADSNAEADADS
ncbi:MAG: hypothetical protein MK052_04155 [Alphaproteobacteria bacterium]|nr:hypothetical protein [Alphaproteobacteria bacterium]